MPQENGQEYFDRTGQYLPALNPQSAGTQLVDAQGRPWSGQGEPYLMVDAQHANAQYPVGSLIAYNSPERQSVYRDMPQSGLGEFLGNAALVAGPAIAGAFGAYGAAGGGAASGAEAGGAAFDGLPSSYWNTLASGGVTSDAAPAAAGTFGGAGTVGADTGFNAATSAFAPAAGGGGLTPLQIAGLGSGVGSALIGGVAANQAANTQANAANQAAATNQQMFNTINSQQAPYRQAGYSALGELLGGTGAPGFQ